MSSRSTIKKLIPKAVFKQIEPIGHLGEAVVRNTVSGMPSKGLQVIGVTGTDGKSTTCMLIHAMLRSSGKKVGLITTICVDYGDGIEPSPTSQTTASVGLLLKMLGKMKANGVEWVVLETSSHALAQHRVWSIPYSVAVWTNLSHEHLDYHGTFEHYRNAKRALFKQTNRNKKGLCIGVINADDPSAEYFERDITNPITYGLKDGALKAINVKNTPTGSTFDVRAGEETYHITCRLPGAFNVYNSLATVAVGRAVGLSKKQIETGIASLGSVPGRMERIEAGQPFEVIVDYAVTPEALRNVLTSVKAVTKGKVHLVFGATGDRDKAKRPHMGKIAAELADYVYLTDDETYTEDPASIRKAVYAGITTEEGKAKTEVIDDREKAIATALKTAKPGDTVLLTGIGHQTTRNMGGKKEPWSDAEVVKNFLK